MITNLKNLENAYLSVKNIDLVYQQINFEIKELYKLSLSDKRYKSYVKNMMKYIFTEYSPKFTEKQFSQGKKTIIFLNAITIKRLLTILVQFRPKEKIPEHWIHIQEVEPGSIPVEEIIYEKSIALTDILQDSDSEEEKTENVLWKKIYEKKIDRDDEDDDFEKVPVPKKFTLEPRIVELKGNIGNQTFVVSLEDLFAIDIMCWKIRKHVTLEHNMLYFSENDEQMISIKIPLDTECIYSYLTEEMSKKGKFDYIVSETSIKTSSENDRFSLLFENTRNNIATILGFEEKNYKHSNCFKNNLELFLYFPDFDTEPYLVINGIKTINSCNVKKFNKATSIESLSVYVCNTKGNYVDVDYIIELKCWQVSQGQNSSTISPTTNSSTVSEPILVQKEPDQVDQKNESKELNENKYVPILPDKQRDDDKKNRSTTRQEKIEAASLKEPEELVPKLPMMEKVPISCQSSPLIIEKVDVEIPIVVPENEVRSQFDGLLINEEMPLEVLESFNNDKDDIPMCNKSRILLNKMKRDREKRLSESQKNSKETLNVEQKKQIVPKPILLVTNKVTREIGTSQSLPSPTLQVQPAESNPNVDERHSSSQTGFPRVIQKEQDDFITVHSINHTPIKIDVPIQMNRNNVVKTNQLSNPVILKKRLRQFKI
jgi:hypothetical protein